MTAAWNSGDTLLLIAAAVALGAIVLLIAWGRIAAFLAIMLGAGVFAAITGLPIEKLTPAFEHGAGGVLGDIGVVISVPSDMPLRPTLRLIMDKHRRLYPGSIEYDMQNHLTSFVSQVVDGRELLKLI